MQDKILIESHRVVVKATSTRPRTIVDSSFWTVAFGARIEVFLPRLFDLHAPTLVHEEMVAASRRAGGATYPYAEGFHLWFGVGLLTLADPTEPWPEEWGPERFAGKGEQHVLLSAAERRAIALINEGPAWRFAMDCGLPVLHVPGWIVRLTAQQIITPGTGLQALAATERGNRTQQAFVDQARIVLHRLQEVKRNG